MKFYHSKQLNSVPNVTHAFTTRDSGNLAFHVNDNSRHVEINHEKLAKELSYKKETLVHMKQIHSVDVHLVTSEDSFEMPPTCDALITDKTNIPLMVMVADCSALLFFEQDKNVIAVAHAGRAGAFGNIVKNVLESFQTHFESRAENILVSIGASIHVCCYEVGAEIYKEAQKLGLENAIEIRENRYYLDVNTIIKSQLLACGIQEEHIEISKECTSCKRERYFSYRAEKNTGRFAGVIMLK